MKIIKPVLLGIFAVLIAVVSAVSSYIITASILNKNTDNKQLNLSVSKKTLPAVSEVESDANKEQELKKYFVKLEGDKINIYVRYEEYEELLYGEQVNLIDLSEEDIKILTEGAEFENLSELTGFTENFIS